MAGFTLFETLVALTLLSLLTVVLAGQVRFGLRAWESVADVADEISQLQTVQTFMRRQLTQTQAVRGPREEDEKRAKPIFAGDGESLLFVVAGTPRLGPAPYQRLSLVFRRGTGDGRLEVEWAPHYPVTRQSSEPETRRRVLLEGVDRVRFSYFGIPDRRDRSAEPGWYEQWNSQDLPELVRMELAFSDRSRYWPEFTVAIPSLR
jgi:type II secretory pathway component PulJ